MSLTSGEPVIERDRPVEEAGPASGESRPAAEADEGAKKASVAAARSDSLLAARMKLANGQVEMVPSLARGHQGSAHASPPLCGGSDVVGASLVVAFRDE
jgi:hypothetical protein